MLLELKNITKSYGESGSKVYQKVLDGLNFSIDAGEKVAVIGPSGSGKTTLLNLIGGVDIPDSGEILLDNKSLASLNKNELAEFRNKELGFVFQLHYLLPQCTLWENVMLPVLPFKNAVGKEDKIWAEHLLKRVGIWEQRFQKPAELSGGECQRTAVVRALINKPRLLLADEPTGALDQKNATTLSELLVALTAEENLTLVTVTHSAEMAALMDKQYTLINGGLSQ